MITEIRVLPPLVIARLGSSPEPLENYDLELPKDAIGFRKIVPAETLYIGENGSISRASIPPTIVFRDGDRIRPVAPFLELFGRVDGDFVPLTVAILEENGLSPADVKWSIKAGNLKVFRRTGKDEDRVYATAGPFSDHDVHTLDGECPNFVPGAKLPLGSVRYIKPNRDFPEIRLRFTPATGKVYGSSTKRKQLDLAGNVVEKDDPVISADRVIYDAGPNRGTWRGYADTGAPTETKPGAIYASFVNKAGAFESWGYLDDECDGIIVAELRVGQQTLRAFAHFGAGPPTFAPDGLPIRTVADELEQALLGSEVIHAEATIKAAEDILRRAFETVRLLNTAVMNGNTINGRTAVASMMPAQDSNDTSRLFAPIMAPTAVDNLAIVSLHQTILAALRSGSRPWFLDALRQPEEVGDLTDKGRRKMPAMMRGADARYMALTRRQIDTIRKAAERSSFSEGEGNE
jgi:hypothetical protein